MDAVRDATKQIEKAQSDIEEEHRRLTEADGGKNAERLQEIETRKEEAAEAKVDYRNHEEELPGLENLRVQAEMQNVAALQAVRAQKAQVDEARKKLDALVRDRGQQRSAYPASLPQLLKAIQQDEGFREKPVGPLGMHVRLIKPAWSSILEKSFGSSLDSFVVTSKEDQIRLSAIMQKTKWYDLLTSTFPSAKRRSESPILIGRSNPIDTREHEPDLDLETSLRVLEVM